MDTPTARPAVMGDNAEAMDVKAMLREEPKAIYHDTKLLAALEAAIDKEIAAAPKDMTVRANREAVKSAAYAVATLKSKLDAAGKDLTEDFRKRTNEVNAVRREITTTLEAKQHALRAPLTEWEELEKRREEAVRDFRKFLEDTLRIPAGVTLEKLAKRRQKIEDTPLDPAVFGELVDLVRTERDNALKALDDAKARVEQDAADKAELERLRIEKAERDAADKARRDAEAAEEEKRIEREAAERERQEAIRVAEEEAAAKVRREAEAAAAEKQRQADLQLAEERAARQREIDAANEARIKAENEAAEIRRKQEAEERERQRLAAEEKARAADKAHRDGVMTMAASDIAEAAGISVTTAMRIVQAIAASSVSNVRIEF